MKHPNKRLYLLIITCSIALIVIGTFFGIGDLNSITCSIGTGLISSAAIAWIIDDHNCRDTNRRAAELRKHRFRILRQAFCSLVTNISDTWGKSSAKSNNWHEDLIFNDDKQSVFPELISDINALSTEIDNIAIESSTLNLLDIMPINEIQNLIDIKTCLYFLRRELEAEDVDFEFVERRIKEVKVHADKSYLLQPINNFVYQNNSDLLRFVEQMK